MAEKFVWQVQPRQEVLDDAMARLRGRSYEVLRRIVEQPLKKKVRSRDQKLYSPRVNAGWTRPGSEGLAIVVRLKRGWFGKTLSDSFRVNPPPSAVVPSTDAVDTRLLHSWRCPSARSGAVRMASLRAACSRRFEAQCC